MADSGISETPELGPSPPTEQERELAHQATSSFDQGKQLVRLNIAKINFMIIYDMEVFVP